MEEGRSDRRSHRKTTAAVRAAAAGPSFIQQLYNTVDLFFVGNLLGTDATAAVGASSLLTSCIVGFFTGLSVGTGVLVSLAEGEKNGEKIRKIIHTAAGISLLGGVLLTVLGLLLSRQLLVWMNTPAEILEQGLLYIRIYLLSMLPLFVYNMNAGIIRAGGDARTPMLFQLLGAAVNILLDWLSMAHWGMGVDGAAWATAFSQMVAALGSVIYLMRKTDAYRLNWRSVRISGEILRPVLRIGVPAGCQNLVITISNIFVQTAVNGLGVTAIAAFTAYFKVELILYLPIMSFGQAATTFAGQNLGAGKPERLRRGIRTCLLLGSVYAAGMAALMLLLGRPADYPGHVSLLLAVCVSGGACGRPAGLRPFRTAHGRHHDLPVRAADRAAGRLYECLGNAGGGGRRLSLRLAGSGSVSDGVLETVCGKTD